MNNKSFIAILFIFSLVGSALAQETVIIPFEEIISGEPLHLKFTLVSQAGEPVLGATIKAKTDFFDVQLSDDGNHDDNVTNDGIYGNVIDTKDIPIGTYIVTYTVNVGDFTKASSSSFKIVPPPLITPEQAIYVAIAVVGVLVAVFVLRIFYKKATATKQRIKDLENKKKNLEAVMESLEQDYYKRVISEDMFKERSQKNREELMAIESELKRVEEKVKKPAK